MNSYKIRTISYKELHLPIEWAAKEGWNPGFYDLDAFYHTDTHGFYMGFLDSEPISSLSAVTYDKTFAFLGFYIVKPEYRGQGYGYKLWQEVLKHLPTQNIGLDGVLAQQSNYEKSGFHFAYRNIRYEGKSKKFNVKDKNIVLLSKISFEKLIAYDDKLFPATRPQFLKYWIKQPKSLAVGFTDNRELKGYGMIRKCQNGYKIGPLFADDKIIEDKIFQKLISFLKEGTNFYFDTPERNKEALELALRYRMVPMFETARMYTREEPKINLQKVFGVTTFELG